MTFNIWVASAVPGPWSELLSIAALGFAGVSLWHHGMPRQRLGLRVDNLGWAVPIYMLSGLAYGGVVLLCLRDWVGVQHPGFRPQLLGTLAFVGWALLQEFCLLTFLLTRLYQVIGREVPAVLATAALFAFFHLPNPFLTAYTLGGGLLLAWLYLRWPNLLAAALGHAVASFLVSALLPSVITAGKRVGPAYWAALAR